MSKYGPKKGSKITFGATKQIRQQDYGLILELEEEGPSSSSSSASAAAGAEKASAVFVKEILPKGLCSMKYWPIMVGDEIIQLNDRSCPEDFKGGLPEIEYYLDTTLQIQFTIIKNSDDQPSPPPKYVKKKKKKGPNKINIVVGSLMQLQGILSKPELNSKVVEVLGKNNSNNSSSSGGGGGSNEQQQQQQQRWDVRILQTQQTIAVTSDKLELLKVEKQYNIKVGDCLLLQEIKSKPELNGSMVRVLKYINDTNRWKVQFIDDMTGQPKKKQQEGVGDGTTISVTPDKLVTEVEFWKNSWRRSGWDV